MPQERCFLALELPEIHRSLLAGLAVRQRAFAWTPPEQLHITLRFIGDVDSERISALVEALERVRVEPFILPLEGVGVFPPRGAPRVVWVGVGSGHPHLFQLRQRVDDALLSLGLEVDLRAFHPHATIARMQAGASAGAAAEFAKKHRAFVGPPFRVDRFALYASVLGPSGAEHELKATFLLGAGGA